MEALESQSTAGGQLTASEQLARRDGRNKFAWSVLQFQLDQSRADKRAILVLITLFVANMVNNNGYIMFMKQVIDVI